MKRIISIAAILGLAACETTPSSGLSAASAEAALASYYATIPDSALPDTSQGKPLPS